MKYFVTACGCVNAYGRNTTEFIQNSSKIKNKDELSNNCLKQFQLYDPSILKRFYKLDICCQYLLEAVNQVMKKSGKFPVGTRIGIVVGATAGPINIQKRFIKSYQETKEANPILFKLTTNNIFSGLIALLYDIHDYNMTIFNGYTSAVDAVNLSLDLLKNHIVDVALVACVESCSTPLLSGAAALMIEPDDRNDLNLEIIPGKQIHLFSNNDILNYILTRNRFKEYDCIYYNENLVSSIKKDEYLINTDLIIVASQNNASSILILNRYNEQLSEIKLKRTI